jgi:hypothetical protein
LIGNFDIANTIGWAIAEPRAPGARLFAPFLPQVPERGKKIARHILIKLLRCPFNASHDARASLNSAHG